MLNKQILVIDYSELFYISLFASRSMKMRGNSFVLPFEYLLLKKIDVLVKKFSNREVILLSDGRQSWRKEIYPDYKAPRKAQRESYEDIDWQDLFFRHGQLLSRIDIYTPIQVYQDDFLESDDLFAVLASKGYDMIAVSSDKDLHQLCIYPTLQLVSPRSPTLKIKEISNPQAELQKLIDKGDTADNIPIAKTDSQRLINRKLVDLVSLPPVIVQRAETVLSQRSEKSVSFEKFTELYTYKFLGDLFKRL